MTSACKTARSGLPSATKRENLPATVPVAEEPLKIVQEDPGHKLPSQCKPDNRTNTAVVYNQEMLEPKTFDVHVTRTFKPQIQPVFNRVPVYRGPFLDALIARYLPDPSISTGVVGIALDMVRFRNGAMPITCSTWLLSTCHNSTTDGGEVLIEAMLSMAMGIVGVERNDTTLLRSAMRAYQKALSRVQKGLLEVLSGIGKGDANQEFLPMSCLACTLTELMANRSMENSSGHMDGIALLLEKYGIARLESSPILRLLFYEHRGIYVAYCLVDRRSCFYSKKKWLEFAMNDTYQHATSYYQMLLDIGYSIPELMEEYDSAGLASVDHLHQMLKRLRQFHHQVDQWKHNFEVTIRLPLVSVRETNSDHLFPNEIHFATMGVAVSLLYYYAFKIHLNRMTVDIADDLATWGEPVSAIQTEATKQCLEHAKRICRSLPYCFDKDKGSLGKLISMFPFDSAWQTFIRANNDPYQAADHSRDVDVCRSTAIRYRQNGIPLFNER